MSQHPSKCAECGRLAHHRILASSSQASTVLQCQTDSAACSTSAAAPQEGAAARQILVRFAESGVARKRAGSRRRWGHTAQLLLGLQVRMDGGRPAAGALP